MFNLSLSEMLLLGVIILIFIGPKELPEIARVIGRFLNDLKRTSGDLSQTIINSKWEEDNKNQALPPVQNTEKIPPSNEDEKK
ncbi:MAG: twin-arginine translocase TatA/TatE family subunit [Bdellovibrionales bacterium]|nr:twin-arginine translocase TatA/TatE family subunit [Bdellovibrionales bacterium]